eukprot:m.333341 g.333341  ORF g.333341 m.333341 type:complete len:394 (-) comp17127_c0_seq1:92-1273(-)
MAPSWLHSKLSREDTEALISEAGQDDGRFLVRTRKKDEYVLCVVYKGKPTHHLIVKGEDGIFLINKKTYGGHSTIKALIEQLSKKTPGWPVPLDKPVKRKEAEGDAPKKTKKKSSKKSANYLHGPITREEAEEKIANAGLDDGRFLLRSREGKPDQYVLCVVYKGKPTHHLISKGENGFIINKKKYGDHNTVQELISQLAQPGTPGWPVPLDKPVPAKESKEEKEAPAKKEKEEEPVQEPPVVEEKAPEKEPEVVPEKEPEPQETEKTEETVKEKSEGEADSQPAQEEDTKAPASQAQDVANHELERAKEQVAQKKAELEELTKASGVGTFRLTGDFSGQTTGTDEGPLITPVLARAVIKMGHRMNELEMQMQQLSQIMESLSQFSRVLGVQM